MKPLRVKDLRRIASLRHSAFQTIRRFFDGRAYLEIDAPILIEANAVETHIDPLKTHVQDPYSDRIHVKYLATSPEIHMKRLLAHGLERIYFLGHVFRDREGSPIHRHEFMMLEWYEAGATLNDLIAQCEDLFSLLCEALTDHKQITRSDDSILDFGSGFETLSMASAWDKYAGIDLESALSQIAQGDQNALVRAVLKSGESLREQADFEDAFAHIMLKKIEPQIGRNRPCALYNWPAQTAALADLCDENPLFAQRFELYFGGMELANAFRELTDSTEQRARFAEANNDRLQLGREALPIDESFIHDLSQMPPASGIAIGIDRLIALISGAQDLREIISLAK
jgi:lysyl-tRNA synthetase class 2